jgi:hypothetical protein
LLLLCVASGGSRELAVETIERSLERHAGKSVGQSRRRRC